MLCQDRKGTKTKEPNKNRPNMHSIPRNGTYNHKNDSRETSEYLIIYGISLGFPYGNFFPKKTI